MGAETEQFRLHEPTGHHCRYLFGQTMGGKQVRDEREKPLMVDPIRRH
jgi:hypothetical protein